MFDDKGSWSVVCQETAVRTSYLSEHYEVVGELSSVAYGANS